VDNYAFGIASIASVARRLGHECKIELVTSYDMFDDVIQRFKEFNPRIVGFTSVTSQFSIVNELAGNIKECSKETITLCGGVHPTLNPESIIDAKNMDLFMIGEGEKAFEVFLDKIDNGSSYYSSPNIVYEKDGSVMKTPLLPMMEGKDLDDLPFPDREIYPLKETVDIVGFAPFHFARGCPFPCTYCSNHAQARVYGEAKSRIRAPSPEYSIREIEYTLKKHPYIKKIAIYDDIFGLNKKWRNEFLTLYKQRLKNLPYACLLRCDVVTEEFAKQLKETGCAEIWFGLESGNEYIRNEVMKRSMSRETIVNAFKLTRSYGIKTFAINLIGIPGETKEMLLDTIKLNREINPTVSGVNIFYPYKGTNMGDHCFEKGLVNDQLVKTFTNERRETILQYDKAWKKKLSHYYENWEVHVYTIWSMRGFKAYVRRIPFLGVIAQNIYRSFRSLRFAKQ